MASVPVTFVPVSGLGIGALFLISLFLSLAVLTVSLRLWSLRIVNRKARLHDWLIFFALFLSCGHVVVIYLAIMVGGMGHHIENVPPTSILTLLKLFFAANLTWLLSTSVVKASILCLYLDLFRIQKTFRRIVYYFLAFVVAFFIAFLISVLTICKPISHLWNPLGSGSCGNQTQSQIATSSINTIVDLAIVLLPIPVVMKLQMTAKKRARIIGIFAVGAIICIINIIRLVITIVLSQTDLTYNLIGPAILTCLEVELGIINACLPTINPVFGRVSHTFKNGWSFAGFSSLRGTSSNSSSGGTQTQQSSNGSSFGSKRMLPPGYNSYSHTGIGKGSVGIYYPGGEQYKSCATTTTTTTTVTQSEMSQNFSMTSNSSMTMNDDQAILVTRDVIVQAKGADSPVGGFERGGGV